MAAPSRPEALPRGLAVHAWALDLHADAASDWDILAEAERMRAQQYQRAVDRRRYVQTRAGLRRLLAQQMSCRPAEVPIVAGLHGKPEVARPAAPRFNVAHAGSRALVALADARRISHVGVDIEACMPGLDAVAMMPLALTEAEQEELVRTRDLEAAMYARWVEKEAVLKAIGVGVSVHLRTVSIHPDSDGGLRVRSTRPAWAGFKVMAIDAPPGYAAALAWHSEDEI